VDGYDAEPWNGVTDYVLHDPSGNVLAVVEAKRCSRNPREADEQLRYYVTEIANHQSYSPFGFMTNGLEIWFWEVGQANPRVVASFFSPQDLHRLLFLRQNAVPLPSVAINTTIVDRPYQHEAIRRVAEAFAGKKRRALLVMATGTGKTRTTMALIDLFLRANQAQNVLFLADRDALVDQALTDGFKAHLPNEPRDRIYTWKVDTQKRLFVATEQTLSLCFEKFSPGFFDLIVFDEAHRSIFRRFTEVIEYFDARMVGSRQHRPISSNATRSGFSTATIPLRRFCMNISRRSRMASWLTSPCIRPAPVFSAKASRAPTSPRRTAMR